MKAYMLCDRQGQGLGGLRPRTLSLFATTTTTITIAITIAIAIITITAKFMRYPPLLFIYDIAIRIPIPSIDFHRSFHGLTLRFYFLRTVKNL